MGKKKGNQICRYTPEKIFNGLDKDNSMFSINILLTGLSRSGKSTFINKNNLIRLNTI